MANYPEQTPRTKNTWKDYFALSEVLTYFFRKSDPNRKPNFNLKMMHGINKISMVMFLICLIVIIVRTIARNM
ncbi:MAG: DUF6728 family protein [Flexibacteraceae bacterium]|jgi:hypothetical protein